ncbi:MAG: PAS domain S-box protein [Deltaproteobacteria bacterium]|nr:PAS domain S-box protein [Deltaproteobacteria bacterium]
MTLTTSRGIDPLVTPEAWLDASRSLLDALIESCVVVNSAGVCLYANEAARSVWLFGDRSPEGEVVVRFEDSSPPDALTEAIRACLQDGAKRRLTTAVLRPDGGRQSIRFAIQPVVPGAIILSVPAPDEPIAELGERASNISRMPGSEEGVLRLAGRLEMLLQVIQDLSHAHTLEAIIDIVRIASRRLTDADGATFVLRDGDMCHYADENAIEPLWKGRRFPMSTCISGWAMIHKKPAVIDDIYLDDRIPHDAYRPTFVKSLVMVPIRVAAPIGAIGTYWARQRKATAEELHMLQALANSTAVAMEKVQILDDLERSQKQYRDLVENLDDVVFSMSLDGVVHYAGPSISKFGYERTEIVGRHMWEFVHPDDRSSSDEGIARATEGRVDVREIRLVDKTGVARHVRSSLRVVHENGYPVGITGILIDLTKQRRVEEQLQAAQRMECVGRLAGGVAHDFNNYLSAIMGYTDMALEEVRETPGVVEILKEVSRAGQRAASLTRQLLAFSRKQVLQPKVVSLNDIVSNMEKMLNRLVQEDIAVDCILSPDLWPTYADPGQVEQVVMNLVVNARDAITATGKIAIETFNFAVDEDFAEQHPTVRPGDYVVLAVSDNGIGMDEETRRRIFEPFFTTKDPERGTGLGLSTVYGIVEQSEGSIHVYSEPGRGTTFRVFFPRRSSSAFPAQAALGAAVDHGPGGGETILVVEDEDAVRRLIERILRFAGYFVLTASNGDEALRAFENSQAEIHLVLTDVVMPRMGGRDLVARLRGAHPELKVLFMSGYTGNAIASQGVLDEGVNFIAKPLRQQDLLAKIRQVLDGPRGVTNDGTWERTPSSGQLRAARPEGEHIPGEIVAAAIEAASMGDADLLRLRIDDLKSKSPALAGELSTLAQSYEFDRIVSRLKEL